MTLTSRNNAVKNQSTLPTFGMVMSGRSFTSDDYRYGFNGKEQDKEGMGGGASTYDYGFRIYNPGIAKFLSVDPLTQEYPWYTPYQFAGNMPIWASDRDGLEPDYQASEPNELATGIQKETGNNQEYIANDECGWNLINCPQTNIAANGFHEGEIRGHRNGWTNIVYHAGGVNSAFSAGWYSFGEYENIYASSGLVQALAYSNAGNPSSINGDNFYRGSVEDLDAAASAAIYNFYSSRIIAESGYFENTINQSVAAWINVMADASSGSGRIESVPIEDIFIGLAGVARSMAIKSLRMTTMKSLTLDEARTWYVNRCKLINVNVEYTEANARKIWLERNLFKFEARAAQADVNGAKRLDSTDPLETFDFYVQKYSARGLKGSDLWGEIINAGPRTRQSINDIFGLH